MRMFLCTGTARIINRIFVHKRLTNILVGSLLSVCAQMVDRYSETKRERKFNENQENNTRRMQAIITGKTLDSKRLTDFLVHKRSLGQIHIVRCPNIGQPFAVQNLLLCT